MVLYLMDEVDLLCVHVCFCASACLSVLVYQ